MKNAGIEATKVMMKSRPARKAVFLRGVNLDSCLVAARGRPRAKRTVGRTSDVSAHGGPPFRRGVSRGWAERARVSARGHRSGRLRMAATYVHEVVL